MANKGIDASRGIEAGVQSVAHATSTAAEGAPLNILSRGVVTKILSDLSIHDLDILEEEITNPKFIKSAPRNSIIVRLATAGEDKKSSGGILCFPFFPPHLCFPVKPGEQVWVINESPDGTPDLSFWMCRVPEPDFVDDINYTHGDRKYSITEEAGEKSTSEKAESSGGVAAVGEEGVPGFPNGSPENSETQTLTETDAYEQIYTGSLAGKSFIAEPVPRFTSRPGDFVIQGSNNTLICLGQDRGWTKNERPEGSEKSNASVELDDKSKPVKGKEIPNFSGTIDIVAGRGRYFEDPDPEGNPKNTQARSVKNAREIIETDKNPAAASKGGKPENRLIDPIEGDPDYLHDASRIYVSMKTKADANFGLEYPQVPAVDDANNAGINTPPVPEVKDDPGTPHIVIKSDEIRIIARRDEENNINGSIKIVKEGDPDDETGKGRAVIMIQPDGTIMIDGPKVVIGSGIEKGNGEGNQVALGLGATEPIVLGNQLKDMLDEFLTTVANNAAYLGNLGGVLATPVPAAANTLKGKLEKFLSKNAKTK